MEPNYYTQFAKIAQQWRIWLLSLVVALSLWSIPNTIVYADPSVDELHQLQQQLQQDRNHISSEKERLQHLEKGAENYLQGLQNSLQSTQTQLKSIEDQIQQTTQNLDNFKEQLSQKEQDYQELAQAAIARFQFLQRQPRHSGWAILLQSQTLTDFLSRRHRLQQLALADRQLLLTVKTALAETQQQALNVEQNYNQLLLMRQQLMNQHNDYQTQTQIQTQLIERLNGDRQALKAAYIQLQQDSKGIEQLIRDRIAQSSLSLRKLLKPQPGKMLAPSYGKLSSSFGWRTHPIFGYERFHGGIDFAADYGSPIYAAHSGIVIFAGWYGGYGNTVILDRGNGITTLYGHASQIYVQEGQIITQGEAIAATGSTGLSTGPHLHFEVRQDGTPVDPINHLT